MTQTFSRVMAILVVAALLFALLTQTLLAQPSHPGAYDCIQGNSGDCDMFNVPAYTGSDTATGGVY